MNLIGVSSATSTDTPDAAPTTHLTHPAADLAPPDVAPPETSLASCLHSLPSVVTKSAASAPVITKKTLPAGVTPVEDTPGDASTDQAGDVEMPEAQESCPMAEEVETEAPSATEMPKPAETADASANEEAQQELEEDDLLKLINEEPSSAS